jgi:hypothetical protein
VFIKHGSIISDVVSLHDDERYYAGTWLPETRKILPTESGRLRKSADDTAAALHDAGYEDAPLALDPHRWLKSYTSGDAMQGGAL